MPDPAEREASPDFLTPQELALRWRMSTRTLDRWRAERYGPVWFQIGGAIRYALADVEAYEARRRRPTR
jgi:hypothetical protein